MSDKFLCPRREEVGAMPGGPFKVPDNDLWSKRDGVRTCSWCGSMNPEDVLTGLRDGTYEAGPTDKNYKMYLKGETLSFGKFYFQHFTKDQCIAFIELLNDKTMKIGYPGHFYSRPYFIAR